MNMPPEQRPYRNREDWTDMPCGGITLSGIETTVLAPSLPRGEGHLCAATAGGKILTVNDDGSRKLL
jgi:hypothetical protein